MMNSNHRVYTVVESSVGTTGGRYSGVTPEQAARKAGRILFRKANDELESVKFTIRETGTQNERSYETVRVMRQNPLTLTIAGKTFVSEHEYITIVSSNTGKGRRSSRRSPRACR